jgi:hypothetical protein
MAQAIKALVVQVVLELSLFAILEYSAVQAVQ